ncbi:MAG: DNA polymerase I [Candidatus Coproplasma sp.]
MDKLVLIDGNSLFNRAFYATPIFTTKDGNPTNAIFGFIKLLFKIISEQKPEYMIVAFDMKAPTFRHKMYDGYKATRKPMPQELAAQIEPLKSLLAAMNIATYQQEGIEADDIIGTLSNKFDVHSFVYTGDRDSYQLVDDRTDVYFTKRGVSDLTKLSKDNFLAEVGIAPLQVIDLKALMGDKSDNIPGVTGIGEKTALNLLNAYGSLDGIYSHIDEIKGATKDKLVNYKDQAYMSYELATINRNCKIDIQLSDCKVPSRFSSEVKKLFTQFEFKSMLSMDIFEEEHADLSEISYPELVVCENLSELEQLSKITDDFYIDFNDNGAEIFAGDKQFSVKVSLDLFGGLPFEGYISVIRNIFADKKNHVVLFNYKQFLHNYTQYGVETECDVDDISVMKYLADFFDGNDSLEQLYEYFGYDKKYSAFVLKVLFDTYRDKLKSDDSIKLYQDIEKPLIEVLFNMENEGVKVDISRLNEFAKEYSGKINELSEKIYSLCGCQFNINSPSQLGEVLFNKLGLKSGKKNKNGKYSTSAEILENLADESEVVREILSFRQYQKLYSTYIEGIRPLIDGRTSLVHTTYNQTVTTTGRLSSTNPNLQNIPIREDEGRELRKLFVPRAGNVFIDADYSQIELRLLAHFSGCKELIDAYNNGMDVHSVTASQVFGVPVSQVTDKMRRDAKAVNFGIIYGISDFGLAKNLKISVKTAREYIENYFKTYSAVKEYMDGNVAFAKEHGYVSTLTGRKRYIREINSSNYNLRQFGERAAMNMPLQGSSADIIKIAMINVERSLKKAGLKSKMILQVHDELVIDAPESEAEAAAEILKYEMENAVRLNVPLSVEVHTGKNWYEAK